MEPASEHALESTAALETDAADEAEGDHGETVESEASTERDYKPLGAVGCTEIASLVLAAGVIVLAEHPTVRISPRGTRIEEVTTRRPMGVAMAGSGGALAASGVTMVVVD